MPGQEPKGDSIRQKIAFYADGLSSFVNQLAGSAAGGVHLCGNICYINFEKHQRVLSL